MDRLTPAARAVLHLARDGHDATPAQRTRADAAVRIGLALHGITDLPPLDPPVHAPHPAPPPPIYPPQHTAPAAPGALSKLSLSGSWKLAAAGSALLFAGMLATRGARPAPLPRAAQPSRVVSPAPAAAAASAAGSAAPAPPAGVTEPSSPRAAAPPRRESSRTRSSRFARLAPAPELRGGGHVRSSRSQVASSDAADDDLQSEVALIGAADELIRAQRYDGALRVLASHAQRFPRGALREERDALRLLAQCGNGLDARAERAVQRFLRTAPRSVVAQRMRESCVASESP